MHNKASDTERVTYRLQTGGLKQKLNKTKELGRAQKTAKLQTNKQTNSNLPHNRFLFLLLLCPLAELCHLQCCLQGRQESPKKKSEKLAYKSLESWYLLCFHPSLWPLTPLVHTAGG